MIQMLYTLNRATGRLTGGRPSRNLVWPSCDISLRDKRIISEHICLRTPGLLDLDLGV